MDPVRLKGLTPDEFERLCLQLARRVLGSQDATRRGSISDPDQGIDIEATVADKKIGIQCKSGKLNVPALRDTLRQVIHYPHRLDRFIIMCAQHPLPAAQDEFHRWAVDAVTVGGRLPRVEIWDPDRIATELDAHPELLEGLLRQRQEPVFVVPLSRPAHFIGRKEELKLIDDFLRASGAAVATSIVGMGGVGKTSLALEYVHSRKISFPDGVYWINGQEDLVSQLARCCLVRGLVPPETDSSSAAKTFLHSIRGKQRALIVIDELDRPQTLTDPIVGGVSLAATGCSLLITSRLAGVSAPHVVRLSLNVLPERDALSLLAEASGRTGILSTTSDEHAIALDLCRDLGHLPLAIQIAGSFLAVHTTTSLQQFRDRLNQAGALAAVGASEVSSLHLASARVSSLATSLNYAYESIPDYAKRVFRVLTMLPETQQVTRDVLCLMLNSPSEEVSKALAWLANVGLLRADEAGRIVLHPISRSFGRSLLSPSEAAALSSEVAESTRRRTLELLGAVPTSKTKPAPKVFLCYAGADRPQVDHLFRKLRDDGFDPWMDKVSLLPGQDWELEIRKAIERSDFFVACVSRHFHKRTYGHKEIKLAIEVLDTMPEGTIYLIPVRLEDCPLDDRLAPRQWVDLFAEEGYERLIQSLRSRSG